MAFKISQQIASSGGKGVADSSQIAYSYKTENGIEVIDKSVKDILDENNTPDVNNIEYKNGVSVKQQLDTLSEGTESVVYAASTARTAESNIIQLQSTITQIATNNVRDMNNIKNSFDEDVSDIRANVESIKNKTNEMHYAFSNGTDFAVMSETEYSQLGNEVQNNVIYFLYD